MNAFCIGLLLNAAFSLGIERVRCKSDFRAVYERLKGVGEAKFRNSDQICTSGP
jgi:hypothetical protein